MVRHWWEVKKEAKNWIGKIFINGTGLLLTAFILISVVVIKFNEGGWITLFITGFLVILAIIVKQNYVNTDKMVEKHDEHVMNMEIASRDYIPILKGKQEHDPNAQTAVMLVKDFNSIGVQTISTILHSFNGVFKNFIFVQVGLVNAGNLAEVKKVEDKIKCEVNKYVDLVQSRGYHAEGFCLTGIDTVEEFGKIIPDILEHFPHSIFFGGQVVFPNDNFFSRWLHNYTLFAIQRRLYNQGISLFILPIYVK
jgi:K+ transporter